MKYMVGVAVVYLGVVGIGFGLAVQPSHICKETTFWDALFVYAFVSLVPFFIGIAVGKGANHE